MKDSKRNNRIRMLVKQLNQQRKQQARQIDMLCGDIISAHRDFINTVKTLAFAADFYESLIGIDNMDKLLYTTARAITGRIPDTNFVFFLSQPEAFQFYAFECDRHCHQDQRLEKYLTNELVRAVTKANKPCDTNDLLQMGLQAKPSLLKDISAITAPIAEDGSSAGFILMYKTHQQKFSQEQIKLACSIRRALSKALRVCTATQQNDN